MSLLSDIKIKVGPEKDCVQTVSVEWSASKVKAEIEGAFESLKDKVKITNLDDESRQEELPLKVASRYLRSL